MDVGDGKELRTYTGHTHSGYKAEADFQSDLSHVLMGSEDGTVRHWDFVTAKSVCVTRAHGKALSSVACHPSKPLFLTASYDGTVGVWENQTK
ncbi:WD40-repeat-containing domain protein [Ochromonadaceae sp. CCMP2298]|nr:WD40-repeat-containing domain protein [Ochromonadaceae sp. CCMP2298]